MNERKMRDEISRRHGTNKEVMKEETKGRKRIE
jgi:hypothetical protein